MGSRYIEPRAARHRVEIVDGVEQLRIPMRRNWFVLLFLAFWLCGWTAGGVAAMTQVFEHFEWFLVFWLGGWACGWGFAALLVASQLAGGERLRVRGGDLEVIHAIGPLRRRWCYRGARIRNLQRSDSSDFFGFGRTQMPLFVHPKSGGVRFDYGSDFFFLANGVEGSEGAQIAEWLAKRLPRSAVDPE